jgi:hypothetical protein
MYRGLGYGGFGPRGYLAAGLGYPYGGFAGYPFLGGWGYPGIGGYGYGGFGGYPYPYAPF